MNNADDEAAFEKQMDTLWKGKEDNFEKAKHSLLSHHTAQQNSQATRLIGFVAGLFVLLQLTQTSKLYELTNVFPNFPTIIVFGDSPVLWDFLKVVFLFMGTWAILFFILRAIFRYAVFGKIAFSAMWVTMDDAKVFVRDYTRKEKKNPVEFEFREIWVLNQAASKKVYHEKIYLILPAKWFLKFASPECPSREIIGYLFIGAVAFILAFKLLLFLW